MSIALGIKTVYRQENIVEILDIIGFQSYNACNIEAEGSESRTQAEMTEINKWNQKIVREGFSSGAEKCR